MLGACEFTYATVFRSWGNHQVYMRVKYKAFGRVVFWAFVQRYNHYLVSSRRRFRQESDRGKCVGVGGDDHTVLGGSLTMTGPEMETVILLGTPSFLNTTREKKGDVPGACSRC